MAERADDPPTDVLDHVCHVGIARRFGFDKAGLETLGGAIEVNALKEDDVKMEIGVRPGLHLMVCMKNNTLVSLIPVTRYMDMHLSLSVCSIPSAISALSFSIPMASRSPFP
jgi:hypothetical protein